MMHESTYGRVHHTVSLAVKYESSQITQQTSCSANRALSNTTVGISIATTTAATTILGAPSICATHGAIWAWKLDGHEHEYEHEHEYKHGYERRQGHTHLKPQNLIQHCTVS